MSELLARISSEPLDPAAVDAAVAGAEHGAVVLFTGVVRNHDGGQSVTALQYQAHPDAEAFLRRCCEDVAMKSGLPVAAVHRVGDLTIGDLALVAAVAPRTAPKPSPPAPNWWNVSRPRCRSGSVSTSPRAPRNGWVCSHIRGPTHPVR